MVPFLIGALTLPQNHSSYFPIKTATEGEGVTAFEAKWFSEPLRRMKEPRLRESTSDMQAEVYRVMILPTWGNPIVVRAQKLEGIFQLSARRLDGQGGYDPGKLVESKDTKLNLADSQMLDGLIQKLDFFQSPTEEEGINGMDGDETILEGVSKGRYHVIERWTATYKTSERGLNTLLELSKFLLDRSQLSTRPQNKGHKLL